MTASLSPPGPNPYAPSTVSSSEGGYFPDEHPLLREELEAFAGKNGRVYWDLLQAASRSRSLLAGFNVAAAAFHFLWLLHRKMYWEFLVSMLLGVPVLFALALKPENPTAEAVLSLSPLAIMVAVGVLGNGLYLRRISKVVAKVRRQESDPIRRLSLLAERGGVSWFGPVIYMIVYSAFLAVVKLR